MGIDPGKRISTWVPTPIWKAATLTAKDRNESLSAFAHDAIRDVASLRAEVQRLRKVIERLGSMEGLTSSRAIKHPEDDELIARIEFARSALSSEREG